MAFIDSIPIIGQAVNTVGSLGASLINKHSQNETNKRNAEQNALNRDFNAAESEKSRQFNAAEAEKSRQFTASQTEVNNQFNALEAEKSYQRTLALQKDTQEYNSAQAQMQRAREAGINPIYAMGSQGALGAVGMQSMASTSPAGGSASASSSPASASNSIAMQSPSLAPFDLASTYANLRLAQSQANLNEVEAKRKEKLLPGEVAIQNGTVTVLSSQSKLSDAQSSYYQKTLDEIQSRIDTNVAQQGLLNAQKYFYNSSGELNQKQVESYQSRLERDLRKIDSEIARNYAGCRVADASISEMASRIALNSAEIANINEDTQSRKYQNVIDGTKVEVLTSDGRYKVSLASQLDSETEKNNYTVTYYRKERAKREFKEFSVPDVDKLKNGDLSEALKAGVYVLQLGAESFNSFVDGSIDRGSKVLGSFNETLNQRKPVPPRNTIIYNR